MVECPGCKTNVRLTNSGRYYKHPDPDQSGDNCDWAGVEHQSSLVSDEDLFTAAPRPMARAEAMPMSPKGAEVAARLKEIFYSYVNRSDSDNRSSQVHIGPSEAGTPCDRRLAMRLMQRAAVNPGGDSWSSFVGSCVHVGLADMFLWANRGTGRYAVEQKLEFPSLVMPKGTGDLLDRTMLMFLDHKLMGRFSLDSLRTSGPSQTYVVQVMLYAYAARRRGETVENVAIVGWPRQGNSLDDLYVWTAPYDPNVAREALERVERIAAQVAGTTPEDWDTADDCRYCPYHGPTGCTGR